MIGFRALLSLLLSINAVSAFKSRTLDIVNDGGFKSDSKAGRDLIASSKLVEGSRSLEDAGVYDFVGKYSIKFLDCHSVNQWRSAEEGNGGEDEEEDEGGDEGDSNIVATNLVRFRLCPASSCQHNSNAGCSSKYGDYLVDMNTFVYNYLSARETLNSDINDYCYSECVYDDDNCMSECFENNGGLTRDSYDDDGISFDPVDYAQCTEFQDDFFLGPYCSSNGKYIHLGVFSDDECSEFSGCDESCFQAKYGYYLPYTDTSMVGKGCVSCAYNYLSQRYDGNNYASGVSDTCTELYTNAGKCETKMSIDYPNESACRYIEGIKYLQKDGVISSNSVKRSKGASLAIGFISFMSILMAVYVHYLSVSKFQYAKSDKRHFMHDYI